MIIRDITANDAEAFLRLSMQLDQETAFMMLEPGERTTTVEQQRQRIEGWLASDNSTALVAEVGGQLVGYVAALGGGYRRNHHSAHLVAGILKGYAGQGLGTRLFTTLERWARDRRMHRLELTVMAHNQAGIALYRKMGFVVEGLKKDSLRVDGQYVDEYYMAKILE